MEGGKERERGKGGREDKGRERGEGMDRERGREGVRERQFGKKKHCEL